MVELIVARIITKPVKNDVELSSIIRTASRSRSWNLDSFISSAPTLINLIRTGWINIAPTAINATYIAKTPVRGFRRS